MVLAFFSLISLFFLKIYFFLIINSIVQHLNKKYSKNIAYCLTFSNIPHLILFDTWTKSSKESQRIQEKLLAEGFKNVIPHIFLSIKWYECWVDQMLRTK